MNVASVRTTDLSILLINCYGKEFWLHKAYLINSATKTKQGKLKNVYNILINMRRQFYDNLLFRMAQRIGMANLFIVLCGSHV